MSHWHLPDFGAPEDDYDEDDAFSDACCNCNGQGVVLDDDAFDGTTTCYVCGGAGHVS